MDENQAMVEACCRLVHARDVMFEPINTVIDELADLDSNVSPVDPDVLVGRPISSCPLPEDLRFS